MSLFRTTIAAFVLACLAPLAAQAQRVYWDPPGGRLGLGKTEPVSLVFEDCSPAEAFRLPEVPGLDFGTPSEAQQTSIINFQTSTKVVLTYPVRAAQKGSAVIPVFDALTTKGKIAVGEVRFEVGEAGVGQAGLAIRDVVSSQIRPARTTLWAGEVLDFEYLLTASTRYNVSLASEPEWKPTGLVFEPFGQPERAEATVGGERRQAVRYRARGLFTEPGQIALDPVRQLVNVQTGERAVGFFSQPRIEQFTVNSDTPAITVKPLPQGAPPGFKGAVGAFTLESTVVPQTARIGEPITWTLTLSGTGNWTAGLSLPEREVSTDFQLVQPKTRTEMESGQLFNGRMIEDAVLVPTVAGTYSLGPVALTWFDTASGQYRTQIIPAVKVRIDPVPAGYPQSTSQAASGPGETPPMQSGLPGSAIATPPPPLPADIATIAPLPGDPLPVGVGAATPRHLSRVWLVTLPLAAPGVVWLVLAIAQALRTDPARDRRLALRELRALVRALARHGTPPDRATLERWRTLTARVWAIRRATPTADDLAGALASARGAARPDDWLALWCEAELAMFSPHGALPADWLARATGAAAAVRIRGLMAWWPARAPHWAPRLAVVACVAGLACATDLDATEARDAYREGRFAEARDAWLSHLQRQPDDWAARINVALASAQLDDWATANAHATAALLLRPRDPDVRRQLRLAATHLDGVDPAVRRLVSPAWYDRPTTWLSPGEWQNLIVGGAAVVGLALLALISSLYLRAGRMPARATGQAMVAVGSLVISLGVTALWRYGALAEPQAAMVAAPGQLHSIPSDAADAQKNVPIPPGTVVVIERGFLGWDRVMTHSGTTGWIRRESLVPFYLPPPALTPSG
ncbi:MAG: protein BatD [Opitutaceae bacterium]|nr:protein BatD [Opitutaceae bacterium]